MSLTSSTSTDGPTAPDPDQIEVSLFGPGYGECILVHVGGGDWLMVDSCRALDGSQPALSYLRSMGVDPSNAIRSFIVTHWHDDHVRLAREVVRTCADAQVVLSAALSRTEFLTVVGTGREADPAIYPFGNGLSELKDIITQLAEARSRGQPSRNTWAIANRRVWMRPATATRAAASATALSPSDEAVTSALKSIATLMPTEGSPRRRAADQRPNHTAVVILIEVADISILLGADLEKTAHPGTGWTAILDSTARPTGTSEVFKVPHHGSANADQPRVWSEMLATEPVAILTPWWRGGRQLPTDQDRQRICGRTRRAYTTAAPAAHRSFRRSRTIDRAIVETVKSLQPALSPFGRITARRRMASGAAWTVSLVPPAASLCDSDQR